MPTTTRLRHPHPCIIRGTGECDSASPTSTAARVFAAHMAGMSRQQRGCAFATVFGRQTDRTVSGETATLDPGNGCAHVVDSQRCESKCCRTAVASRELRSASQSAISSSGPRGMSSWSTNLKVKDSNPLPAMPEKAEDRRR